MERLRKWNTATSVLPSMVKGINWTQQASINRRTDNSQRFQKWLSRRMYRAWQRIHGSNGWVVENPIGEGQILILLAVTHHCSKRRRFESMEQETCKNQQKQSIQFPWLLQHDITKKISYQNPGTKHDNSKMFHFMDFFKQMGVDLKQELKRWDLVKTLQKSFKRINGSRVIYNKCSYIIPENEGKRTEEERDLFGGKSLGLQNDNGNLPCCLVDNMQNLSKQHNSQ